MLLTRLPLSSRYNIGAPLDLHVLGTPPALTLSQDQTLQINPNTVYASLRTFFHKPESENLFGSNNITKFNTPELTKRTKCCSYIRVPIHTLWLCKNLLRFYKVILESKKTSRFYLRVQVAHDIVTCIRNYFTNFILICQTFF